ncbi:MAG: hypothetical protein M0P31_13345 [Solirubrobacteraceae bacterium]|nr:hypothetical protein [Solirubrobacteraceae bacterium]
MASSIPELRPSSLARVLDELGGVLSKTELAVVAGVSPTQLSPSRFPRLGREPIARLDDLWAALRLARDLPGVEDVAFFLRARQPDLGFATPLTTIAAGDGQLVIDWLRALASGRAAGDADVRDRTTGLQPLGRGQRPPVASGALRPAGRRPGVGGARRAELLRRAARRASTQDGVDPAVLEETAEDL